MGTEISLDQVVQSPPPSLALNTSSEGASTSSLGNLFQCLTTLSKDCPSSALVLV